MLISGSDSWITDNWCDIVSKYLLMGYDLIGKKEFYTSKIMPNRKPIIIKRRYNNKIKIPVGQGRIISRKVLNKMNWKLFPKDKSKALDTHSTKKILDHGGKIKILELDKIKSLGIRSTWETLSQFKIQSKRLINIKFIEDHKVWINEYFPDSVDVLDNIIENIDW